METFYLDKIDILVFVSQMKDEAVNAHFMSSIEVFDFSSETRTYLDKLGIELVRTLPTGGIVICANESDHPFSLDPEKYGMKRMHFEGEKSGRTSIFIKE